MGMITRAIVGESNFQNNTTSNVNIRGEYFSHFGTIGANLFGRFEAFGNNNNNSPSGNNNNNNPPPLLPLPEFEEGLERGFNLPLRGNVRGLDLNVVVLVNI